MNLILFKNFIAAVAARTAQLLNYSDLAADVGISDKTAKKWLSVLEMSGLVYILQPYYNNFTKRISKTPKMYFLDTGLAAYLTRHATAEQLEVSYMNGAFLETYVLCEILKSYWLNAKEAPLYFYRASAKKEIDFIIDCGPTKYAIEIKKNCYAYLESC